MERRSLFKYFSLLGLMPLTSKFSMAADFTATAARTALRQRVLGRSYYNHCHSVT